MDPTEVPPNFNTIIFIGSFIYKFFYIDKIHLINNVNIE